MGFRDKGIKGVGARGRRGDRRGGERRAGITVGGSMNAESYVAGGVGVGGRDKRLSEGSSDLLFSPAPRRMDLFYCVACLVLSLARSIDRSIKMQIPIGLYCRIIQMHTIPHPGSLGASVDREIPTGGVELTHYLHPGDAGIGERTDPDI